MSTVFKQRGINMIKREMCEPELTRNFKYSDCSLAINSNLDGCEEKYIAVRLGVIFDSPGDQ
jgi:hypothetical protein